MLVSMKDMLIAARVGGYGVGGFEFWSLDSALAVVETARKYCTPVILQVGHFERDYMLGYKNARKVAEIAAAESDYPVALHLDHAESIDEVARALDGGFTSVMIDASALPFAQNVETTCHVVELAKPYNASVEAELGRLAGCEGITASRESQQTDPLEAEKFAAQTSVDALAVGIGTAHGFYTYEPVINIPLLAEIASLVKIPLVLHGGSGTPNERVSEAIALGIAKINICTEFIAAFGYSYTQSQQPPDFRYNVFSLFRAAKEESEKLVAAKIQLFLGR